MYAVIVEFNYDGDDIGDFHDLEEAIDEAAVGEFDSNELGIKTADARLFMYGPDADALLKVVEPILQASTLMRRATVLHRDGDFEENAPETRTTL